MKREPVKKHFTYDVWSIGHVMSGENESNELVTSNNHMEGKPSQDELKQQMYCYQKYIWELKHHDNNDIFSK